MLTDGIVRETDLAQKNHDTQVAGLTAQLDAANAAQAELRKQLADCQGQLPTVPPNSVSGFAPQSADLPHFKNVWFDDFKTPVTEGGFHLAYPKFNAYQKGWPDTNHNTNKAVYMGFDHVSVSDDRMKVRLTTPAGKAAQVTALGPNNDAGLLGMRAACAFRVVNAIGGYHPIPILTWPKDEQWPAHGEIDFTENDSHANDKLNLFTHRANPNGGVDGVPSNVSMPLLGNGVWHLLEYEWIPKVSCSYWIDGKFIVKHTTEIPYTPHRWVMQLEGTTGPNVTGESIVEFDWASQWQYVA